MTKTLNPAKLGLTKAEHEVFCIVKDRQESNKTITSGDISKAWGDRDRTYVYRKLEILVEKNLIERYSRRYYRIKE